MLYVVCKHTSAQPNGLKETPDRAQKLASVLIVLALIGGTSFAGSRIYDGVKVKELEEGKKINGEKVYAMTEAAEDALKSKAEIEVSPDSVGWSHLHLAGDKDWRAAGYKVVEGMEKQFALCGNSDHGRHFIAILTVRWGREPLVIQHDQASS